MTPLWRAGYLTAAAVAVGSVVYAAALGSYFAALAWLVATVFVRLAYVNARTNRHDEHCHTHFVPIGVHTTAVRLPDDADEREIVNRIDDMLRAQGWQKEGPQ